MKEKIPFELDCLNPAIFRAYDIRGIVPDELTEAGAYRIGQAYGTMVRQAGAKTIALGYDGRLTSLDLAQALEKGLISTGLRVLNLGLGPSPLVYFTAFYLETDAAIMVTGSHNPGHYNGFKMMLFRKPFFGAQINALKDLVFNPEADFIQEYGFSEGISVKDPYLEYMVRSFKRFAHPQNPLRVVWDAGHGATADLLTELVEQLPGEHILLNATIDGTFPGHHPDPAVAANLKELQETVVRTQADVGFAFDGDGDRIGVVDNQGHILWGDQLVMLLSEEILQTHPGATIIADIKASQLAVSHIENLGGQLLMCRTGHSLIKSKMAETNSPLAGEMSGHLFFADRHYGYDDGLYGALRVLTLLSHRADPLSTWYNHLPKLFTTPEIRLSCTQIDKFDLIAQLKVTLGHRKISFNETDGVRVSSAEGWWLVRASNTADELTLRLEGFTHTSLQTLKQQLSNYLKDFPIDLSELRN